MTTLLYVGVSSLLLALFGAGPARAMLPRDSSRTAVAATGFGLGAILLTLEALLFAALGIPWSVPALSFPLLVVSVMLVVRFERREKLRLPPRTWSPLTAAALIVSILAVAVFAVGLANSSANSVDFVLFYGVKALFFARARGIPVGVLAHPFFVHAAPRYPPLMPVVEAWGVLVAGNLPWRFGPAISFPWLAAGAVAIWSRLSCRLGPRLGSAAAAYWTSALAVSFVFSYSGGNGEAPLVFFVSVAGAWLLTEAPGESRLLPACLLAGAALAKQEGLVAALGFAAGTALRDALLQRPRAVVRGAALAAAPVIGALVWLGWQRLAGLSAGYRPPAPIWQLDVRVLPSIAGDLVRNLDAGTRGLSWALPLLLLARPPRRLLPALPALVAGAAIAAALLVTYLSPASVARAVVITRTLPRACQPVLSLLILGAAVRAGTGETDGERDRPLR